MELGLRGKCAVLTGASKGIGRATALRLAEEGANVAICARGEPALRETEVELRSRDVNVHAAVCDVGDHRALDGFLEAAREELGQVDILVNNATAYGFADDPGGWESSLNVDLMAAVRFRRAGWASRRRWPTSSRSWSPTVRDGSRGPVSWWTEASTRRTSELGLT
jgi:3-oxoacyl-[acyl-carrier protein] reductase